jgi:hypothetical protein
MFMRKTILAVSAFLLATASGCAGVSKEAYDRDLAGMKQQQDWLEAQKKTLAGERDACQGSLHMSQDALQGCIRDKQSADDEIAGTRKALEQCTSSRGSGGRSAAGRGRSRTRTCPRRSPSAASRARSTCAMTSPRR